MLLGLLTVWYTDFFGAQTQAVLPYDQYLKRFPAYLQQLTMESNGKHVTLAGDAVDYADRPGVLGRARHQRPAQLLPADPPGHASSIPADFIGFAHSLNPLGEHHDLLTANVFAQTEALAFGKTAEQVARRGHAGLAGAAPGVRGQPAVEHAAARPAHARTRWARWSRCTSTACSCRARCGASTPSTSGASSSARCSPRRWPTSSTADDEPELEHDSSTNALIRRYRAARSRSALTARSTACSSE